MSFAPNAVDAYVASLNSLGLLVDAYYAAPARSPARRAAKAAAVGAVEALIAAFEAGAVAVGANGQPYFSDSTLEALDAVAGRLATGGAYTAVGYWLVEAGATASAGWVCRAALRRLGH